VSRRKGCGRGQVYGISHVFIIALGEFSTIFFLQICLWFMPGGEGAQGRSTGGHIIFKAIQDLSGGKESRVP
jgi:hypothetical protein